MGLLQIIRLLGVLAALLLAVPASAQIVLPAQSVLGNPNNFAARAQPIPIATLATALMAQNFISTSVTTVDLNNMPAQTVVGNMGSTSGPIVVVSYQQLYNALLAGGFIFTARTGAYDPNSVPPQSVVGNPIIIPSAPIPVSIDQLLIELEVAGFWSGPLSGLTHRWQMDAGSISNGKMLDLAGSLNATISATGTSTGTSPSGIVTTAMKFDGASGNLTLASSPVTLTGPWTIAFWLNMPDITFTPSGDPRLYDFDDGTNSTMAVNAPNGGLPGELDVSTPAVDQSYNGAFSNNTWTHVTEVYTGSALSVYINGVFTSSAGGIGDSSASGFKIASKGDGTRNTKGSFYQFVTYNRALSAAEVLSLYQAK